LNFLYCICLVCLTPVPSVQAAKQPTPDELRDLLQRQINWDDAQPSAKNPDGLHFHFYKTDETTSFGKHLLRYRVYVPGAQESKRYALTVWKIGSDPHILSNEVYVNTKGLLMAHRPRPDQEDKDFVGDDELHLSVQAALGEPIRYALASSDKQVLVTGTLVPFPIVATDKSCRLEVRLGIPDGNAVLIYADGLPANTEIPFQLVSAGKPETDKFSVDAVGHAVATDLPYMGGESGGSLQVIAITKECSASVEVLWGEGSYNPL